MNTIKKAHWHIDNISRPIEVIRRYFSTSLDIESKHGTNNYLKYSWYNVKLAYKYSRFHYYDFWKVLNSGYSHNDNATALKSSHTWSLSHLLLFSHRIDKSVINGWQIFINIRISCVKTKKVYSCFLVTISDKCCLILRHGLSYFRNRKAGIPSWS